MHTLESLFREWFTNRTKPTILERFHAIGGKGVPDVDWIDGYTEGLTGRDNEDDVPQHSGSAMALSGVFAGIAQACRAAVES